MKEQVLLLILSTVLTFIASGYWFRRNSVASEAKRLAEIAARLDARVHELEVRASLLQQTVSPISVAFQEMLVAKLTHHDMVEMDALLVKLGPPSSLNNEEEARLAVMLEERSKDDSKGIDESERDAASILLTVVRLANAEAVTIAAAGAVTTLKIISVPVEKK